MKLKVKLTCKLCDNERQLSNSHIIPEFLFEPIYGADKRRTQAIETKIEPFQNRRVQIGWRDHLLCKACESKISKFESYVKDIWYIKKRFPFKSKNDIEILSGLDYNKFKLFHLSVLWKAGVSKLEQFKYINLAHHQNVIKNMLITEDAGDDKNYQFFATAITLNGEINDRIILGPEVRNMGDHQLFIFVFGGCVWYYVVSDSPIGIYSFMSFGKQGNLILKKYEWHEVPLIRDTWIRSYKKRNKII